MNSENSNYPKIESTQMMNQYLEQAEKMQELLNNAVIQEAERINEIKERDFKIKKLKLEHLLSKILDLTNIVHLLKDFLKNKDYSSLNLIIRNCLNN